MATLSELSGAYMDAAVRLRAALDEVRAAMENQGADRRALEQRARLLEGMLREMRRWGNSTRKSVKCGSCAGSPRGITPGPGTGPIPPRSGMRPGGTAWSEGAAGASPRPTWECPTSSGGRRG